MLRQWKDGDTKNIDVDCRGHCCLLRLSTWDEAEEPRIFSLSFWKYIGARPLSLMNRFRAAWKMLRYGTGYEEIILDTETAQDLAVALEQLAGSKRLARIEEAFVEAERLHFAKSAEAALIFLNVTVRPQRPLTKTEEEYAKTLKPTIKVD